MVRRRRRGAHRPSAALVADAPLVDAWTLVATGGWTDCPALDPAVYGTSDVRTLLRAAPDLRRRRHRRARARAAAGGGLRLGIARAPSVSGLYWGTDGVHVSLSGYDFGLRGRLRAARRRRRQSLLPKPTASSPTASGSASGAGSTPSPT
ncbi:MAG: hypothetical protein R3F59_28695 [Myxococcota bacterium]